MGPQDGIQLEGRAELRVEGLTELRIEWQVELWVFLQAELKAAGLWAGPWSAALPGQASHCQEL